MNRSRKKSPARRGSASPSRRPRRNVSKSPTRRSLRERSRSRNRKAIQNMNAFEEVRLPTRQKSPSVQQEFTRTVTRSLLTKESRLELDNSKLGKISARSSSVDRDEVIRNSISRFDDVVSEAVVTVRSRMSQECDLKAEVEKQVKTLIHGNNVSIEEELPPRFFGGWFGALLLIFIVPAVVFMLQIICTKDDCQLTKFRFSAWLSYLDMEATSWYIGFLVWQLVVSLLPLGPVVRGFPENDILVNCRCNGLVNLVLTASSVIGIWHSGYIQIGSVLDKSVQLLISSIIVALFLSVILFFKGSTKDSQKSVFGNTGNFIYDFWIGRQINPRMGPIDVKLFVIRSSLILAVVINILLIIAESEGKSLNSQFSTPLLLVCALQIAYLSDFFIFEKDYLTSFTIQHEGLGYMLVMSSAVFPFFITFIPKSIFFNKTVDQYYILAAMAMVHCVGYTIFRMSNGQKASFRKDFHNSPFSSIDSLVCIDGRRLLVGGWWGRVRHPNHLGCLIMYWSWSLTAFCAIPHPFILPFIVPSIITVVLFHRCARDFEHCKYRYGSSWNRYASRTKYHMFPKVF